MLVEAFSIFMSLLFNLSSATGRKHAFPWVMSTLLFSGVGGPPHHFLKILYLKQAKVGTAIGNGEGRIRIMVIWPVQELELHNPKLYWQHAHFHNQNIDHICPLYPHYFSLFVYSHSIPLSFIITYNLWFNMNITHHFQKAHPRPFIIIPRSLIIP